jgi:HAD superfamily hydrolase (TIGR01549 family)
MGIKAVLFDFIGTTVIEKDPSVITNCFVFAFEDHGVQIEPSIIKAHRGKDKRNMVDIVLSEKGLPLSLTEPVLKAFQQHLQSSLDNFGKNEGADEIIHYLKDRNIFVGLGSGLSRDMFEAILYHIGWSENVFDYIGIAEEIGKSRPDPAMLLDAMRKLNVHSDELLKVGDTVADVQEGKNARVKTIAILSGTQDEKEIVDSGPDFSIQSLMEIKQVIR